MIYFLNIIIFIQKIKDSLDIGKIFFIGKFHIGLWQHRNLCICHWNILFFQCLAYLAECIRCSEDLVILVLFVKTV